MEIDKIVKVIEDNAIDVIRFEQTELHGIPVSRDIPTRLFRKRAEEGVFMNLQSTFTHDYPSFGTYNRKFLPHALSLLIKPLRLRDMIFPGEISKNPWEIFPIFRGQKDVARSTTCACSDQTQTLFSFLLCASQIPWDFPDIFADFKKSLNFPDSWIYNSDFP